MLRSLRAATVVLGLVTAVVAGVPAQAGPRGGDPPQCNGLDATIFGTGPFVGTAGPDVIVGTPGNDIITAGDGDDVICSLGGKDRIRAGNGDDTIFAGPGADVVRPGDGDDTASGGKAWDHCTESGGLDTHIRCERRVVARVNGALVGVPLGTSAGQAIQALEEVFGPAREDTGWIDACEFDGTDPVDRSLRWGGLTARFLDEGGNQTFTLWAYRLDFTTLTAFALGPKPAQVTVLPGDPTFGGSIADAATATGGTATDTGVFGYVVDLSGMVLYSLPDGTAATSDPFVQVGVPLVPGCEYAA
jgi:Ca2+-binding RTX toxin-like protein